VYPDPRVARFISENFTPVRLHIRDQAEDYRRIAARYGVQWTPTILIIDSSGTERHRIEGFLPTDDFLGQLLLGLAHSAFARGNFTEAERLYRQVVADYPATESAAEALYWAGVSRYKATNDGAALGETARQFRERYRDTTWAKKASVWSS
jgi:hypothetical protein